MAQTSASALAHSVNQRDTDAAASTALAVDIAFSSSATLEASVADRDALQVQLASMTDKLATSQADRTTDAAGECGARVTYSSLRRRVWE